MSILSVWNLKYALLFPKSLLCDIFWGWLVFLIFWLYLKHFPKLIEIFSKMEFSFFYLFWEQIALKCYEFANDLKK